MKQDFDLKDYIQMQNDMMQKDLKCPTADVVCYGDDGEKVNLKIWYDEIDAPIIEKCKNDLFIKAYSTESGREGVNTQTSDKIDLTEFGYGPNSTVAIRRLIALHSFDWTLQYLEDNNYEVYPKRTSGEHLDLRRQNLYAWNKRSRYGIDVFTEESVPVLYLRARGD